MYLLHKLYKFKILCNDFFVVLNLGDVKIIIFNVKVIYSNWLMPFNNCTGVIMSSL